jgi:hypothetical protein
MSMIIYTLQRCHFMSLSIQAKHAGAPGLVPALQGSHISRHRARAVCMKSRPPLPLLSRLPLAVAAAAAHDGAAAAAQASTSRVRRVHLARPPRRSSQTARSSAAPQCAAPLRRAATRRAAPSRAARTRPPRAAAPSLAPRPCLCRAHVRPPYPE